MVLMTTRARFGQPKCSAALVFDEWAISRFAQGDPLVIRIVEPTSNAIINQLDVDPIDCYGRMMHGQAAIKNENIA